MEPQPKGPGLLGGRFALGLEIAKRPSCKVYRAVDKNLGDKEVAVKIFMDGPGNADEHIKQFEKEVNELKSASHVNLVPIITGGYDQDTFYIAMELIGGVSLRDRLKEQSGKWDIDPAVAMVSDLAAAVGELHERGEVHGHIDSRAILFKDDDVRLAGYCPRVIEKIQRMATSAGRVMSDPAYVAPEQISGSEPIDSKADIYALGVVLYELITGERPFQASNPIQAAMMRASQPPPSPAKLNSAVSPLLDAAVQKAMAREPKDRFQNVRDFVDAISGGKRPVMNPLQGMQAQFSGGNERVGTATIAVSMSTEKLKEILRTGEPPKPDATTGTTSAKAVSGESTATAMGMKAVGGSSTSGPKPSLLGMSGNYRNKKFVLERSQFTIGSDSTCDVVVQSKGVPARYAIVVQRGDDYCLAPLSPTPLRINGANVKNVDEVVLKRGDVVNVGDVDMRYVAPGEVFTMRDDVADRLIDRPKNKTNLILLGTAAAVVVAAIGGYYLYTEQQQQAEFRKKQEAVAAKQKADELVRGLLREGDEFYKAGALVEPLGANAEEKFRQVLALDPNNEYAKNRLGDIERRQKLVEQDAERRELFAQKVKELTADADRYFQRKEYVSPPGKNAKETYQEILRLDTTNAVAKKRIGEIDKIMGDLVGRVGSIMQTAQDRFAAGSYVQPEGDNALFYARQVLDIDPKNDIAKELIINMGAMSVFKGDAAKAAANADEARRQYLIAQAVGADPVYIAERTKGLDFIKRTKSGVVIYSDSEKQKAIPPRSGPSFLDSAEIERRVAELQLKTELNKSNNSRRVVDVKGGTR